MAAFTMQDLEGVDWPLFQNGWITKYWKLEVLEDDIAWLAEHRYKVYRLNCQHWTSKAEALNDLGTTLEFPGYYGQNLDAFNDCLSELDVPVDGGSVIVLYGYDQFVGRDESTAYTILDICAQKARMFMLFGQRLATLVQSDNPRLEFNLVGATPVILNRLEWLNKFRGL